MAASLDADDFLVKPERRRNARDGSFGPIVVRKPTAARGTGLLLLVISGCLAWSVMSGAMPVLPSIAATPIAILQFSLGVLVLRCRVTISPSGVSIRNYRTSCYPLWQFDRFEEIVRSTTGNGRNPTKVVARSDAAEILAWALSFEYASGDRSIADGRILLRELNEEVERLRADA